MKAEERTLNELAVDLKRNIELSQGKAKIFKNAIKPAKKEAKEILKRLRGLEEKNKNQTKSKLQALKEEVEEKKQSWIKYGNGFPMNHYRQHESDGAVKALREVLNLITNQEDK